MVNQSFITTTDSNNIQTFTVPTAYTDTGATFEVVGPGGNGAAGTTGTAGNSGGGGSGGGYAKRGQTNALGLVAGETLFFYQPAGGVGAGADPWFNPTNDFLHTAFDGGQTNWPNFNDTSMTLSIADPFGGTNACNIVPDVVNTFHLAGQTSVVQQASTTLTFSLYAKANGYNFVEINVTDGTGANGMSAIFDLSAGVIDVAGAIFGTFTGPVSASIIPVPGAAGWYRFWISATGNATTTFKCNILIHNVTGGGNFAGDGTSNVTVFGPQLNLRNNVPGPYVLTTTAQAYTAVASAGLNAATTTGGIAPTTGGQGDLVNNGGNGGNGGLTRGGGGGGGAAGPTGAGKNGGAPSAITTGGGGGGGADNGTAGASPATTTGGVGGNGKGGSGGGTGGTVNTGGAATANSGGGGGGGFMSAVAGANSTGGAGATDQSFDATHGPSGGGGGGGGNSATTGAPTTSGGAGVNYGSGGGGAGYIRNAGTQVGGAGAQGVMLLTFPDLLMSQGVM